MYTSVRYICDKGRIPLKLQNIVKQENLHESKYNVSRNYYFLYIQHYDVMCNVVWICLN